MAQTGKGYYVDESTRPKLPRNIYDYVYQSSSESTSLFASSGGYTNISQVGTPMPEISVFTGATSEADGTSGLVPAPVVGDQLKFLQGTGAWIDIPAYRWLQEFPSNSTTKTGLTIVNPNGRPADFNVTGTLSTQTLKVSGSAHFWSLVIDEAKANGGNIYVSPALFEVDYVGTGETYPVSGNAVKTILQNRPDISGVFTSNNIASVHTTRAYMRCDDGERRTKNECEPGDMLRCKQFNIQANVYENVSNKDYWTFVVAVSDGAVDYNTGSETVKCFWIDLADYLITSSNGRVPFNSSLEYTGGITVDPGQTDNIDLTTLKQQAQRTWTGSTSVDSEYGTVTDEIRNYVLGIYGVASLINSVASNPTRSLQLDNDALDGNYTEFELNQIKAGLNTLITGNTVIDNEELDASNIASMILDGELTYIDDSDDTNLDNSKSMTLKILGVNEEMPIEFTDEESEETTPGGMNREPTTFISGQESEETHMLRSATLRAGSGSDYNWQTDPDYTTWQFGYGVLNIEPGDHLASLGHLYDEDRMGAIVIAAGPIPIDNDLESPSIAQYANINRFGDIISKFRTTALAKNGNEFTGSFLVNHEGTLMDVNERINLFITDLNTGLETVGIHLDGENSTIKLVGSVEIRQHSTDSYDTLSVYDSSNNKKVEITPKAIPALTDLSSTLTIPANNGIQATNFNTTYSGSSNVSKTEEHSNSILWGAIQWGKYYHYELKNASHTFTTTCELGNLVSGDYLTIGSGTFTFRNDMFFNGQNATIDRTGQTINSFYMRIKRGSTTVWTVDLKSNFTMPSATQLASSNFIINIPSNMKARTSINTSGSYSVEFSFAFTFKGAIDDTNNWANPKFSIDSVFVGSFNSMIERSTASNDAFMQIGNNGLAFNMGANRYMYAGGTSPNAAMKFNWYNNSWTNANAEGVGISFNDTAGMQIIRNVRTLSAASNTLQLYDDYVILDCSGKTSISITLPSAANYGKGRILEVVTKNRSSSFTGVTGLSGVVMKNHTFTGVGTDPSEGWQNSSVSGTYWDGTYKFINDGSTWYEI